MAVEYRLSDRAWAAIEPLLPKNQPGAQRVNDRRVISGIIHVLRVGCRWQDCLREWHELCVSGPAHAVSDAQASTRPPDIMANWLRAANHSRTFRPSFTNPRIAK